MKVLIWTRQEKLDSGSWNLQGFNAQLIHLPCLQMSPLEIPPNLLNPKKPFSVAVLTSANTLSFAPRNLLNTLKSCQKIFSHGPATIKALEAAGLSAEHVPVRTAEELGNALLSLLPKSAHILLPGAKEPAFDLAQQLINAGYTVTAVASYETHAKAFAINEAPLTEETIAFAKEQWSGGICFASPSAVLGFVSVFSPDQNRLGAHLTALALGPTTAKECEKYFSKIKTAKNNTISSLMEQAKLVFENDENLKPRSTSHT